MTKILITDDSPFIRMRLKKILGALSVKCKLFESHDKDSTLKEFAKTRPDLVLLDIVMSESEEDGVEVLKLLLEKNPRLKVIMVTAVGYEEIMKECRILGATDYIVKPFDEEDILNTVKKYIV